MQQYKLIATYGFAIFTMFFGSGNLVFPLSIGYYSANSWLLGFLGLLLTGVVLPFSGLFVIKFHKGNYKNFFNEAGSIAGNIIPFFTLSLLGSFGVVPRCITVAHGGISHIFPELSLWVFASLFCIVSFFLCLKDQIMVKILGKWMSPILLIILVALIGFGIAKAPPLNMATTESKAFIHGFLIGYQTMDLFAAFFFSALIFKQIQNSMPASTSDKTILLFAQRGGGNRHFCPAHCSRFPTVKVAAVEQTQYNVVIDGIELLHQPYENKAMLYNAVLGLSQNGSGEHMLTDPARQPGSHHWQA